MRATILGLTLTALALQAVAEDCSCGYSINATNAQHFGLFTQKMEHDFVHSANGVTWDSEPGLDWQAQEYNMTPSVSRGPYGRAARASNVMFNVLPQGSTGGSGTLGGDPGLQLWTRSELIDIANDQYVPIAELVTAREDILYGSFRASIKTTSVNGTCSGWFFYHNDSQEIDMEILSKEKPANPQGLGWIVHLINQSPTAVAKGYNLQNTTEFIEYGMIYDPSSKYTEFRIDWLPDRIDYYADGQLLATQHDDVPTSAGALHLIHWSNGNSWSGGPPKEDAVLTVAYINAYFNTTSQASQAQACGPGRLTAQDTCMINDTYPQQPNVAHPSSSPVPIPQPSHSAQRSAAGVLTSGIWEVLVGTVVLRYLF